jgi:hypothetical protein
MKTQQLIPTLVSAGFLFAATTLQGADVSLFESAFNSDGVTTNPGVPAGVDVSGFDYTTGLGTIVAPLTSGSHFVGLYVDHEIDEAINTFFNEYGAPVNSRSLTQSWEIDEPGFVFGDIYTHFTGSDASSSLLDNLNGVPAAAPDDVSMAIGWNVNLGPGETGTVTFVVGETRPTAGFFLEQIDPESSVAIYFSSTARVNSVGIPDGGGTLAMQLGGLAGLATLRRRLRT